MPIARSAAEGREHRAAKEERERREVDVESAAAAAGEAVDRAPEEVALRWGSREAEIEALRLFVDGREQYHVRCGEPVRFELTVRAHRRFEDFVFGIGIFTPRGVECWGTNTDLSGFEPGELAAGTTIVGLDCPRLRLGPGEYLVDVAVHARDGAPYDYRRRLVSFTVTAAERGVGVYFPEHRWTFDRGAVWKREPSEQREQE